MQLIWEIRHYLVCAAYHHLQVIGLRPDASKKGHDCEVTGAALFEPEAAVIMWVVVVVVVVCVCGGGGGGGVLAHLEEATTPVKSKRSRITLVPS